VTQSHCPVTIKPPKVLHGRVVQADPLVLETLPEPWAYAASLRVVPNDGVEPREAVVDVHVVVTSGSIGIGCLDATGDTLLEETVVSGGDARVTLYLGKPRDVSRILLRNGPEALSSTFELRDVQCRVLPEDAAGTADAPPLKPMPGWSRYYRHADTIEEKRRARQYLALTEPARMPWIHGLTVIVHPRDQLSRAMYVSRLYEPGSLLVLERLLHPGDTFLDVGAHAGIFTLVGSRAVGDEGRVLSFEPSHRERERLEAHVALNALRNVTVVAAAVTDRQGDVSLRMADAEHGGLNTLGGRFAYDDVPTSEVATVPAVTLDGFCRDIDRIGLIKLDIEGAEYAALCGARDVLQRCRPAVILEMFTVALHANGASRADLEGLLRRARYRFYAIDESTAALLPLASLADVDEQNIVALPEERRLDP
jgi:FkbM family methyltransferase